MSLDFMKCHGHEFVELIPHFKEQNREAWKKLRGEIADLEEELKSKFNR
jgi:hypothetical protein